MDLMYFLLYHFLIPGGRENWEENKGPPRDIPGDPFILYAVQQKATRKTTKNDKQKAFPNPGRLICYVVTLE